MTSLGPQAVVTAPLISPPNRGLIVSANEAANQDARWENGYAYAPENVNQNDTVADACSYGTAHSQPNAAQVTFNPYIIEAFDQCSSFAFQSRDYVGRAQRLLLASQEKKLAHEFWSGTQAQASGWANNYLANSHAANFTEVGTGLSPEQALACLEMALSHCGSGVRGMIHCSADLFTHWSYAGHAFERVGKLIITQNDTIIVCSPGYDGSGPDNAAPVNGAVWAYATGIVNVRLGDVVVVPDTMAEAIDKSLNTVKYGAYRAGAADWDNVCHFAVSVNINVCTPVGS